jgi:hypothetical protein
MSQIASQPTCWQHPRRSASRRRGAAAVLAMMFLVIFGSLATAMAIVAQGNLRTADSHLKLNSALSAADSGMKFVLFEINEAIRNGSSEIFVRSEGEIDSEIALEIWQELSQDLRDSLLGANHNLADPFIEMGSQGGALHIGPIALGTSSDNQPSSTRDHIPVFTAIITPHPIVTSTVPGIIDGAHPLHGHSYDSVFYARRPYDGSEPDTGILAPVSEANPLDARWWRIKVTGVAGPRDPVTFEPGPGAVVRSVSMDIRIDKRLRAAVLSKSRVMVGRHVMIEGRIGSTFEKVHLDNGHPIQMESDFLDLLPQADVDAFIATLIEYDTNGDNRIRLAKITDPHVRESLAAFDYDGDGYVDDWDLFFKHFDTNGTNTITIADLQSQGVEPRRAEQLVELITTFRGGPARDYISIDDQYAKVRGEVLIGASKSAWESGAAYNPNAPSDSSYRDYFTGAIHPTHNENPLTFEADESQFPEFDQDSFEPTTTNLNAKATVDVFEQATPVGTVMEAVPFGAAYPYDYYERPVFRNEVFTNARIPMGTNALFENCRFIGVTYVETWTQNGIGANGGWDHPTLAGVNAFNYSGMQEADGSFKHPDIDAALLTKVQDIRPGATTTKDLSNNIRFHSCRFEGPVISGSATGAQPRDYTHTRNKLTFTGDTVFADVMDPTEAPDLLPAERLEYRRGSIITPHYSIEMGTFTDPYSGSETIRLTGTIVAGIIDMRGQVRVDGTIIGTFEPRSNEGPVLGETSPQFNTTLGYFSSEDGDLEAELPPAGLGVIQLRYNPNLPLPDGVKARVSVRPMPLTYFEGGRREPTAGD